MQEDGALAASRHLPYTLEVEGRWGALDSVRLQQRRTSTAVMRTEPAVRRPPRREVEVTASAPTFEPNGAVHPWRVGAMT